MSRSAAILGISHARDGADLFRGSPAAIHTDADALTSRADDLEDSADRLRRVDLGQWSGAAADASAEAPENTRRSIVNAADAYTSAASALRAPAEFPLGTQPSADQLLDHATSIDQQLGHQVLPPVE